MATTTPLKLWHDSSRIPYWIWPVSLSAVAWAIILLIFPPSSQDFPLGDDWAFAHGAIWFSQGLGIHYSKWASMPQLGQWVWALPFLKLFDSAHFALRLSTITLSCLGMVSLYDLMRQELVPARLAAFAASVLALNPLYFVSQSTFMTDVPALSFGLIALNCYHRAIRQQSLRWLLPAVVIAIIAGVTRQTLILVPVTAAAVLLQQAEIRKNLIWLLSIIVPIVISIATAAWFYHRPDVLPMAAVIPSLETLLTRSFVIVHLCGLVVLPIFILTPVQRNWKIFAGTLASMIAVSCYLFYFHRSEEFSSVFPYCSGMLSCFGTYSEGLVVGRRDIMLTTDIRLLLTFLGCIGGSAIISSLATFIRRGNIFSSLAIFTFLQFCSLMIIPAFYDRYLESLFPGALFLLATTGTVTKRCRMVSVAVLLLYGAISISLVHDWLSWNVARWQLGKAALAIYIDPRDIEGGFEWNGWYGSDIPGRTWPRNFGPPYLTLEFSRTFFPQVTGKFALAFNQPPDSEVMASARYNLWLSPSPKEFLLVRYYRQE